MALSRVKVTSHNSNYDKKINNFVVNATINDSAKLRDELNTATRREATQLTHCGPRHYIMQCV